MQFVRECAQLLSYVWLFVTPWTVARQAPPSMGFSRQEYWSGFPFPTPGNFSLPKNQTPISCVSCAVRQILYYCTTNAVYLSLFSSFHVKYWNQNSFIFPGAPISWSLSYSSAFFLPYTLVILMEDKGGKKMVNNTSHIFLKESTMCQTIGGPSTTTQLEFTWDWEGVGQKGVNKWKQELFHIKGVKLVWLFKKDFHPMVTIFELWTEATHSSRDRVSRQRIRHNWHVWGSDKGVGGLSATWDAEVGWSLRTLRGYGEESFIGIVYSSESRKPWNVYKQGSDVIWFTF